MNRKFRESFKLEEFKEKPAAKLALNLPPMTAKVFKAMPPLLALDLAKKDKAYYDGVQQGLPGDSKSPAALQANVVLLAACQDDQLAGAPLGLPLSLFTYFFNSVWATNPPGQPFSYQQLLNIIVAEFDNEHLTSSQRPNLYLFGPKAADFAQQPAFH